MPSGRLFSDKFALIAELCGVFKAVGQLLERRIGVFGQKMRIVGRFFGQRKSVFNAVESCVYDKRICRDTDLTYNRETRSSKRL